MRFIVSGLNKKGHGAELYDGKDRVEADAKFNASLSNVAQFAVIEMKSGSDQDVKKWTNVMRQQTHATKAKPVKSTPTEPPPAPEPPAAPVS